MKKIEIIKEIIIKFLLGISGLILFGTIAFFFQYLEGILSLTVMIISIVVGIILGVILGRKINSILKTSIITVIIILIPIVLFSTMGRNFYPYPYIDTKFTSDFSWEKWNKISEGMTRKQVHELLGYPLSNSGKIYSFQLESDENIPYHESYSERNINWFAWAELIIYYDNDEKVIEKKELMRYTN